LATELLHQKQKKRRNKKTNKIDKINVIILRPYGKCLRGRPPAGECFVVAEERELILLAITWLSAGQENGETIGVKVHISFFTISNHGSDGQQRQVFFFVQLSLRGRAVGVSFGKKTKPKLKQKHKTHAAFEKRTYEPCLGVDTQACTLTQPPKHTHTHTRAQHAHTTHTSDKRQRIL